MATSTWRPPPTYDEIGKGSESKVDRLGVDADEINVAFEITTGNVPYEAVTDILSFVPDKWLLNCALVCKAWRDAVASQTFWRRKCLRTGRFVEKYMAPYYPENWKEFYFKSPYTRNLIKNPSGKDGRKGGWIITQNGGDGWCVETGTVGSGEKPDRLLAISNGSPHQFATSYGWCERHQVIDLLAEGFSEAMLDERQPDVLVSEWYAPRFDCGNVYELKVQLLREKDNSPTNVIDEFVFGPLTTPQWAPRDWKEVEHVFSDYGPGLRFIRYQDKSKDTQFWAGHYGSKMAGSVVRFRFHRDEED